VNRDPSSGRTLRELAHARVGDKGNVLTIMVRAFDAADYPELCRALPPARVLAALAPRIVDVEARYELPQFQSVLFRCRRAPGDTVTMSLHLDAHGKALGALLLDLDVEPDAEPSVEPSVEPDVELTVNGAPVEAP
jgi:hypothetical protein